MTLGASRPAPRGPERPAAAPGVKTPAAPDRGWLTQRWLGLVEALLPAEGTEGAGAARSAPGESLAIHPGRIEAQFPGRPAQAFVTTIRVATLSDQDWDRIINAMAGEALYPAKLLGGEVPEAIDGLMTGLGLELLPRSRGELDLVCTCERPGPCPHLAATASRFADRLDDDPLVIFTLRGLPGDQLLDRLRQARLINAHGVAPAHVDPLIPESQAVPPPLEACIDDFWRSGTRLAELKRTPPAAHASHALLRRLGPSPLGGKFPLVGLLASIYDAVANSALRMRNQD